MLKPNLELAKFNGYAEDLNSKGLNKDQIKAKLKDYLAGLDETSHAMLAVATSKKQVQK